MGPYYPVCLNLAGKTCAVVGGGSVAERKVRSLFEAGGGVRVVSPRVTKGIKELTKNGKVTWLRQEYEPACLEGSFLVVAATGDRLVNSRIVADCKERNILVNTADSLPESDFIASAHFRRGDLVIAVSTGGKGPALAAKIRGELESLYGPEYAVLLDVLGMARDMARRRIDDPLARSKKLKDMVAGGQVSRLVLEGRLEEAREEVRKCLSPFSG
ncbi:MAG: bifunctional precorrin-2 dehydrogenase/sirohydrochlorin ferrochelatase [Peptococcaceae bacterium]|jgi:precorrin-2 dehydrogenase/sirohydrochlorin ferrochelatase|nr:bifunctional precorrin-2 dehydrogenase/sirohydrochlorin ferrochelatase [Peptococcaceae bacterium]MDH7525804.1 bifunctional precorrin-2 dehydrogenase/sirohydrochlorin ferrochelatase [Peptococcaceae bacterium]